MPLAPLPSSTIRLIGSSQTITSVSAVIKELMENSIDAGAQHIEIKLDKHGLERIEVKDDGRGIGKNDATVMCLPHYTSKISDFSDLDNLSSYGFRGEALSALCNVAQVSITTTTDDDDMATCYIYDHNGQVTCSKISHISKGTIVTVTDLFKNLPVRKQFISTSKKASEELKRVEKVIKSLAVVHPRLRVTFVHNRFLIWQKTSVANLRQSVMQVVNINIVKQLHHILHCTEQIRVEMLVPKQDCDVSSLCFSNFTDAYFLFVNTRPVRIKEVEKAVYNKLFEFFGVYVPSNKYPVCVTCLTLPPDCLDVNLEPNKTRVYFKNQDQVLDFLSQCMHIYYGEGKREEENLPSAKLPKKRKVEIDCPLDPKKVSLEGSEELENSIVVEAIKLLHDQNIAFPSNNNKPEENDSNSETVTCSGQSTSKQESCSLNNDSDCAFEQFCLEREKENNNPVQNGITSEVALFDQIASEVAPLHEISKESVHSSTKVFSTFFSTDNNEHFSTGAQRIYNNNECYDNFINKQHNTNYQTDPEPKIKEHENTSLMKKVDTLKKIRENSLIAKQIQTMDRYLSTINEAQDDSVLLDESSSEESNLKVSELKTPSIKDKVKEDSRELSPPTLSQWSKGEIISSAGVPVKGTLLLNTNPVLDSPCLSEDPSNRSVSSQMGCKEMSAFTKFARKMRKKILEEQPDLSFTKVAQMLQAQWRHLDDDEKKKYEETDKINKSPHAVKQKPISAFFKKSPNIELEVSMDNIKQMVKEPIIDTEGEIRLIGQLESSPLWLYHKRNSGLFILSVTRLLEAVKFHKHLNNYALPIKLLNDNVTITKSDLTESEWEILLNLERSPNGVIRDTRLIYNGFCIEIKEGETEAQLTYVPQHISFCKTEEVQEILNKLQIHGSKVSLAQSRPLKVISFIRSEVMRECSQEQPPSQAQVCELLSYFLSVVSVHSSSCIHHHPVIQCIHTP